MSAGEHVPPLLPPEHAASLRAVDVRLYFGIHGTHTTIRGHGPAVLGVNDEEYANIAQMATGMEAGRGDVLAQELSGFTRDWHLYTFVDDIREIAEASPYLDLEALNRPAEMIQGYNVSFAMDTEGRATPASGQKIKALAEDARRFRVLNPFDYATALAVAKGIPCHYADADSNDTADWKEFKRTTQAQGGLIGSFVTTEAIWRAAEISYRDRKMVARLGAIASSMQPGSQEEPPHLCFIAGEGHRKGVTRLLEANDIPFSQHPLSPNFKKWNSKAEARMLASVVLPFVASHESKNIAAWIANARNASADRH